MPIKVRVIQRIIRPSERLPPDPEPTSAISHPEIGIQNDAIQVIVAAA